ncbi:DUF2147 domain-containing protein [Taibaiella koreensis]|uniref:DUF2147 domain-containing protein n=1 Tax=Taibaiella koreensis TaxID=1268548 RepID=UPI001968DAF7|nr:DUF2147 domain-containing protein [Taibaiella koreensis]
MMKKIALLATLLLGVMVLGAKVTYAQKDKVEGFWLNQEKEAKIEIYKAKNGKFYGKIVWLKEPNKDGKPKTDVNNPKENLQSQPIIGLLILKGFNKDGDKMYEDGTIYDPKNGKTYSCKITYESDSKLSIRGYVGISMLGRTTTWTRSPN